MFEREANVVYSSADGFHLEVSQPTWRKIVRPIYDAILGVNARFWVPGVSAVLSAIAHKLISWELKSVEVLAVIPITREIADNLAYDKDDWNWLDDE